MCPLDQGTGEVEPSQLVLVADFQVGGPYKLVKLLVVQAQWIQLCIVVAVSTVLVNVVSKGARAQLCPFGCERELAGVVEATKRHSAAESYHSEKCYRTNNCLISDECIGRKSYKLGPWGQAGTRDAGNSNCP